MTQKRPTKRAPRKAPEPVRLDIACGTNKPDGWTGIDLDGDADIVHDLFTFPWPLDDNSVGEARCSHFVEHIPHWRPGWDRDGWWLFWDEVYRVLVPGGRIEVWHPWSRSDRAWWDPTHERAIADVTWYYLNAQWRAEQGLAHYPVTANFDVVIVGQGVPDQIMSRSDDFQVFARTFYANVMADLNVVLTALPPSL